MKNRLTVLPVLIALFSLFGAGAAWAHVTPSVKLSTTRETVQRLLPDGKLLLKDIHLTPEQTRKLRANGNWDTHEDTYRFYVSRDEHNRLKRAMIFMTEFTLHGPIVIAVALDPQGTVADALITDVQMEPLEWVGPLLRANYMEDFKGKDGKAAPALDPKWRNGTSDMTQAYALIIAGAVQKSAQLFAEVFNGQ
jgi:hypothetical protein